MPISRIIVWIWAGTVCGTTAAAAESNYHYYYFKQQRTLRVDATRIAVRTPQPQLAAPGRRAALQLAGLDSDKLTKGPLDGWTFAPFVPSRRDADPEQAIRGAVAADLGFVSPVFIGDDGGPLLVTPDILIQFESSVDLPRRRAILSEAAGLNVLDENWAGMPGAYRLRSSARNGLDVLRAANALALRPDIRFAEPDVVFTGRNDFIPNDTLFGDQWEHNNTGQSGGAPDIDMDSPEAWDITTGNPSILVVVIDVGVEQTHPDINQVPGDDTTGEAGGGGPVNACDNHGTAVAGCVSAVIDNGIGVTGVAPNCRVASARTFISTVPCDGSWSSQPSWTVNSLAWAQTIGARVTNNSNYYGFSSGAIATKYALTRNGGMVHFASAGNDNANTVTYPASLPEVMAIGAINRFGAKASFSNFGFGIDFTAPGDDIVTTDRTGNAGWVAGDYVVADGTSFASPYSAGVAALALSRDPTRTAVEVEQIMRDTSTDLGTPGRDNTYGWGVVNAFNVVSVDPCQIAPATPEPGGIAKNRYISFVPGNSGTPAAIRVELTELMRPSPPNQPCCPAPDFSAFEGQYRWVGPLDACVESPSAGSTFSCAVLQCTPYYQDWDPGNTGVVIHVTGSEIAPSSLYRVQLVSGACDAGIETNFTSPLDVHTARWSDVSYPYQDPAAPFPALQPSAIDIAAIVDKVADKLGAASKTRTQLQPRVPNPHGAVSAIDIASAVGAVKGDPYPFLGPIACP